MVTEDDVRRLALSLPVTTEKPSYGTPGFRVADRLFARIHESGDLVVWVEDVHEKSAMLTVEPAKFRTTDHYEGQPMLLVQLDAVDADELAELLTESWRWRAPAKARRQLESGT